MERVVDSNLASSIELAPSLIAQLGEAFRELKTQKDASGDNIQWNEIEDHFRHLESTLKKKFEDLEVKEKEFTERESETCRILAEREAAVAAKELGLLNRVQELKDAAVAAVLEAQALHMPESLEPSSGGDGTENKVSSPLDDENAPTDAQEEKSPHNTGENTEGVAVEVNPRPELMQFCEQMDAKGLLKFTMEYHKSLSAICKELTVALGSVGEPARLVLDSLEGFFPSDEPVQQGGNRDATQQGDIGDATQQGDNGDASQQGGKGDAALKGMRQSCLIFMEALAALLAKAEPDADNLLNPETKQLAKAIADEWKPKLAGGGTDTANGSSLEAEGFLRLLATFRIASEFDEDLLCELVLAVAHQRQAPELCHSLGLAHKAQGIVETLINRGKQIDAVHFIQSFELSEKYPPVPLLKTYLKDLRRNSQGKGGSSGGGTGLQIDCNALELAALRAVIGCIKEYKLEASYPLDSLQKRVLQLEKAKGDRKRTGDAGNKHQHQKKQRSNGGFQGHRARGGGRHPPTFFNERAVYAAGMGERYAHTGPSTYSYPVSSQPAYAPQANDQRSYYYPQDDRASAPSYSTGAPTYNSYIGGGMQPAHQPYM